MTITTTPGPHRHMRTNRYAVSHAGSIIHECASYRTACRWAIRSIIDAEYYGWFRRLKVVGLSDGEWLHVATIGRSA